MKVYVVGGAIDYANWLVPTIVSDVKDAEIVLFTGGEDVSPSLYGDVMGEYTHANPLRDAREVSIFEKALELQKPMLGICRGSQFLCVMAGGKLVQHMEHRHNQHYVYLHRQSLDDKYSFPEQIMMTSSHHQLAFPYNLHHSQYRIIGTSQESRFHLNGKGVEIFKNGEAEPEIIYYRNINALGIQGHPEWMFDERNSKYAREFTFLNTLIKNLLNNKL